MSRSIDISYWDAARAMSTEIEVLAPYFMLGTQASSMKFWSIPLLREVGITHLTVLGESDPVYFGGWDMMDVLWREIELLQRCLGRIDFFPKLKAEWAAHITYCYILLVETTPREYVPCFNIG